MTALETVGVSPCHYCGEPSTATDDHDQPRCDECGPVTILCCLCGNPTTWDETYEDLCYRCCRADNE